jgi:hypothetical protein
MDSSGQSVIVIMKPIEMCQVKVIVSLVHIQVSLSRSQFSERFHTRTTRVLLHGAMRAWYLAYDDLKVLFSRFLFHS